MYLEGILSGEIKGAKRDLTLVNAAGGFVVAGLARDMSDGIALARQSHRKRTRVTKAVEQAPSRIAPRSAAILPLIEKASCLLPACEVVTELHAVLFHDDLADGLTEQHTLLLRQTFEGADPGVIALHDR